ncbi:hypothetical protein AAG570_002991 [Ranatra chinensis]|uniref:Uncharacterized protein n=1 Tax=Ranatra chinensis TaxID=642074 RepID=A0ABD0Y6L5_9HEMI
MRGDGTPEFQTLEVDSVDTRRCDMSSDPNGGPDGVVVSVCDYHAEGPGFDFLRAVAYYRFAEELAKTRKRTNAVMNDRAMANICINQLADARDDVDTAMELDPTSMDNKYANAYLFYQENKFEDSLIQSEREFRRRQKPNYFLHGIQFATGTIENCVGTSGRPFTDPKVLGQTIIDMKLKELDMSKPPKMMSISKRIKKEKALIKKKKCMSKKILGGLAEDKPFLIETPDRSALSFGNEDNIKMIKDIFEDGNKQMRITEATLWKRKPLYSMMNRPSRLSAKMIRNRSEDETARKNVASGEVLRQLGVMNVALGNREWARCYKIGGRIRELIMSYPDNFLPQRAQFVKAVHFLLGQNYLTTKVIIPWWPDGRNDERIYYMLGATKIEGNILELYKDSFHSNIVNNKKFMEKTLEELDLTKDDMEVAFLSYELACCLSIQGKTEEMKNRIEDCILASRKAGDLVWYINGLFLLARAEVQDRKLFDARVYLTAAGQLSAKFGLLLPQKFAQRSIVLLKRIEGEKPSVISLNEERKKELMDVMANEELMCRLAIVLRDIKCQPVELRMPLVPGMPRVMEEPPTREQSEPECKPTKLIAKKIQKVLAEAIQKKIDKLPTPHIADDFEIPK